MMTMLLPPSPALSECDSLDGIDDLDAFLASQGQLSQWPTPPSLKKSPDVETSEIESCAESEDDSFDFAHIATVLSEAASIDIQSTPLDIEIISDMLIRADLPLEVIALALNILSGLQTRQSETSSSAFTDTPPDLLVVGAFSLAVSYTNDHAPRPFWWSHFITDCHWTAKRIDRTVLKLLGALDFSLYQFTRDGCMQQAMKRLTAALEPEPSIFEAVIPAERQPLHLFIDSKITSWQYGQLTPHPTPPCSAINKTFPSSDFEATSLGCRMPLGRFLPVL